MTHADARASDRSSTHPNIASGASHWTSQDAIRLFRRSAGLSRGIFVAFYYFSLAILVIGYAATSSTGFVLVIALLWVMAVMFSVRSAQSIRQTQSALSIGDFDSAEESIRRTLGLFSLNDGGKLVSLYHLAMIRHARRRFSDAAALSREVLLRITPRTIELDTTSRMILVDSLIELGEINAAAREIVPLRTRPLGLRPSLGLMQMDIDLLGRLGAWNDIGGRWNSVLPFVELMPSLMAARTHAWLGLAALRLGRSDWADIQRERAELLADFADITRGRPELLALWQQASSTPIPSIPPIPSNPPAPSTAPAVFDPMPHAPGAGGLA